MVDPAAPTDLMQDAGVEVEEKPIENEAIPQDIRDDFKFICDKIDKADETVRSIRTRLFKRLACYWDGKQNIFWDETIEDYREWADATNLIGEDEDIDVASLAKSVNYFKTWHQSIIAALTAGVPKVKYIPDDAEIQADLDTAKAYQAIQKKIEKVNPPKKLVTKALKIKTTQGGIFAYIYPEEDKKAGFYQEPITQDVSKETYSVTCPACNAEIASGEMTPEVMSQLPLMEQETQCPSCGAIVPPIVNINNQVVPEIVDYKFIPKHKICIDLYGPLHVQIPFFVTKLDQVPVLTLITDMHYAQAIEAFDLGSIPEPGSSSDDRYDRWSRMPNGFVPDANDLVTVRRRWLRPWAFYTLGDKAKADQYIAQFPEGCLAVFINEDLVKIEAENLDDYWVVADDPLEDFLQGVPSGEDTLDIQDLINQLLNLTVDTVEHNIPELFVRPETLGLDQYSKQRARPGNVTHARPRPGMVLGNDFFESSQSTLSQEHNQFASRLEAIGQVTTGALPSIYGGAIKGGSNTAREYESSRAMALQRISTLWDVVKEFYAGIMKIGVPMYANLIREDEKFVEENGKFGYINIYIRMDEIQGRVGEITYDTNEQIPVSWAEQRDILMQLIPLATPDSPLGAIIMHPANAGLIAEKIGLHDIHIPGDEDREKQLAEIAELIKTPPMMPDPMMVMEAEAMGQPLMPQSSIPVDPMLDNHMIEAETCATWLKSMTGRAMKKLYPEGYQNVYLHWQEHNMIAQQQMQMQAEAESETESSSEGSEE